MLIRRPYPQPGVVAHADWSVRPHRRWMAVARRDRTFYDIEAPRLAGDPGELLTGLIETAPAGPLLIGFDFPIGLPLAYAKAAGVDNFRSLLPTLGAGEWSTFYSPAAEASEIAFARPFYPARPGGTARSQLTHALGLADTEDLLRACERKTRDRNAACSLFWTLGGNQVGRAAISGWREVLAPALRERSHSVGLWPFDGSLAELVARKRIVIVETYPAEACVHLGMKAPGRGWSKKKQADRIAQAEHLHGFARASEIRFSAALEEAIATGFGARDDGEDKFDSVIGVLSMLAVVLGARPDGAPDTVEVRTVEGWIFGQQAPAGAVVTSPTMS